jgi:hypothetical protein
MEYRWCLGCGVLISDLRLVFCTEQCREGFYTDSAPQAAEWARAKELGGAIVARLEFMQWVRAQRRLTIFEEGVTNSNVIAGY